MNTQQAFRILTFWCLLLTGCQQEQAFSPSGLDSAHQSAFKSLLNARRFAGNPESFMPEPENGQAFAFIRSSSNAKAVFHRLLDKATLPGQLYALCYFYYADKAVFGGAAAKYRQMTRKVLTMEGDVVDDARVCDIVDASLRSGTGGGKPIRLRAEKIFGTWYEEQSDSGVPDIVGGFYPFLLWHVLLPEEKGQADAEEIMLYTGVRLPNAIVLRWIYGGPPGDENDPYDSIALCFSCADDVRQKMLAMSAGQHSDVPTEVEFPGFKSRVMDGDGAAAKFKAYSMPAVKRRGFVYRVAFAFGNENGTPVVFIWAIKNDADEKK